MQSTLPVEHMVKAKRQKGNFALKQLLKKLGQGVPMVSRSILVALQGSGIEYGSWFEAVRLLGARYLVWASSLCCLFRL